MRAKVSQNLKALLLEILAVPSPSFAEQKLVQHLLRRLQKVSHFSIEQHPGGIVATTKHGFPKKSQHVAFFGHLDVVPKHVEPSFKAGKVYGAGASDMKAGVAAMLYLIEVVEAKLAKATNNKKATNTKETDSTSTSSDLLPHCLSFVFYCREEVSAITDNGLYDLLQTKKAFFKSIDLAIVGEPTDKTLQLGAVGSAHASVVFRGKAGHSARPWQGVNAVYESAAFVSAIKKMQPKRQRVFGLDFFDTIEITECECESGKTTIPSWWKANINYRFAPKYSAREAKQNFLKLLEKAGAEKKNIDIHSLVYAGKVLETPFLKEALADLAKIGKLELHPKQAWTDVAQLSYRGIPAFNYGPGLTSQCHRDGEYTLLSDLVSYVQTLSSWLKL